MRDRLKAIADAIIWTLIGAVIASFMWANAWPDQRPLQPCVPLYDQTGLECCQPVNPDL